MGIRHWSSLLALFAFLQADACCLEVVQVTGQPSAFVDGGTAGRDSGVVGEGDSGLNGERDSGPDAGECLGQRASNLDAVATYTAPLAIQVVSGDLNGDGLLDLVASGGGGVAIYFGCVDGGLSPGQTFGPFDAGAVAAIGDLDGDGIPDVAASGGSQGILLLNWRSC